MFPERVVLESCHCKQCDLDYEYVEIVQTDDDTDDFWDTEDYKKYGREMIRELIFCPDCAGIIGSVEIQRPRFKTEVVRKK